MLRLGQRGGEMRVRATALSDRCECNDVNPIAHAIEVRSDGATKPFTIPVCEACYQAEAYVQGRTDWRQSLDSPDRSPSPPSGVALRADHIFRRPPAMPERMDVPPATIVSGRWQPRRRFDAAKLQELERSLQQHGVLTPLKVFVNEQGQLELIAGERRRRAAQQVGLALVPVEIVEWSVQQVQEVAILDNLHRENLTPEEEGAAFEMAIQRLGLSEVKLAERLGLGRAYIQQRRTLASADETVRDALNEGLLTFSQVRGLLAGTGSDTGAQRCALREMMQRLQHGPVDEVMARALGTSALLHSLKRALAARGFWLAHYGDRTLVYSQEAPPRAWTPTEVAAALQQPSCGAVPMPPKPSAPDPSSARLLSLMGCSFHINLAPPWILVEGRGQESEWLTLSALVERAERWGATHPALCHPASESDLTKHVQQAVSDRLRPLLEQANGEQLRLLALALGVVGGKGGAVSAALESQDETTLRALLADQWGLLVWRSCAPEQRTAIAALLDLRLEEYPMEAGS